jgi:hypothetical protein
MAYDRKQGRHQVAQSSRPDYRLEVGQAEVPVGAPRGFVVLDPARAATLKAWTSTVIPAAGRRPDAGSVGAAEYIDATVYMVPSIRPALLHGIDEIERLAHASAGRPFNECGVAEREGVLRQFQGLDPDTFSMVGDLTYEAYYGNPEVLAAVEGETGWRGSVPMTGSPMTAFDVALLERVRKLPARYRAADGSREVKG